MIEALSHICKPLKLPSAWAHHASMVFVVVILCSGLFTPSLAQAQGMADVASGLRTDPDAPIEVEADQLDIYDKKKVAIFTGNVIAKQGETQLNTSTLTIHYSGGGAGTAQSITRLEANGGVIVSQKDQKATGNRAFVDMTKEQITLSGNVVLTQGKNVLRGKELFIDMRTGAARLASAAPANAAGQKKGRVQGLFTPNRRPK